MLTYSLTDRECLFPCARICVEQNEVEEDKTKNPFMSLKGFTLSLCQEKRENPQREIYHSRKIKREQFFLPLSLPSLSLTEKSEKDEKEPEIELKGPFIFYKKKLWRHTVSILYLILRFINAIEGCDGDVLSRRQRMIENWDWKIKDWMKHDSKEQAVIIRTGMDLSERSVEKE